MAGFKLSNGAEHRIALTIGNMRKLRAEHGVDLLNLPSNGDDMRALHTDDVWVTEQVERLLGIVDVEGFEAAADGPAVQAMRAALIEELERFFSGPRAEILRAAGEKFNALLAAAVESVRTSGPSSTPTPAASE